MKKTMMYVFLAVVLIAAAVATWRIYGIYNKTPEITAGTESYTGYYAELVKQCEAKGSPSCCMTAVKHMSEKGYKVAEDNKCPDGFTLNGLRCKEAFSWCEPKLN